MPQALGILLEADEPRRAALLGLIEEETVAAADVEHRAAVHALGEDRARGRRTVLAARREPVRQVHALVDELLAREQRFELGLAHARMNVGGHVRSVRQTWSSPSDTKRR